MVLEHMVQDQLVLGPISQNFKINFKVKINFNSTQALGFQLFLEIKSDIIFLVTKQLKTNQFEVLKLP